MSEENSNGYKEYTSTPLTNRKIRNPFDKDLIAKLDMPICSPGMCKTYKKQGKGAFVWEIEQASTLIPADIVACSSQFEPVSDPVLEKIAEEATAKFFSKVVVPSPPTTTRKHIPIIPVESVDNSTQTVLSLPPILPKEVEKVLEKYYNIPHEKDLNLFGEFEVTANNSLKKTFFFEVPMDTENSDLSDYDDSNIENRPLSSHKHHSPVTVSPNLSCDVVRKGLPRCFATPGQSASSFRNKLLQGVDDDGCLSPIHTTPQRNNKGFKSSPLTLGSVSPITNGVISSDDEKLRGSSPESEAIATCLDCVARSNNKNGSGNCFCSTTPNRSLLRRSASMKESPIWSKKNSGSFSENRNSNGSNMHRTRSVQKLNFNLDMSIDGSFHENQMPDALCEPEFDVNLFADNNSVTEVCVYIDDMLENHQSTLSLYK